jgi:cytochrome o ubiquinol oxidase subunit 3
MDHEQFPDTHHDIYSNTIFGFWLYLLTDFILFGSLFAVYVVLKDSVFGGPSAQDLFSRPFALVQALLMTFASFTAGVAGAYAHRENKKMTIFYFLLTFLLGLAFLGMQASEFHRVLSMGHSWKDSAFLSAYFSLVGTFGIHVIFALLWTPVILFPIWKEGINIVSLRRITCLKMFWQFINLVWIFIFTIVYLMGVT